jgi:lysozyme family protein
MAEIDYEKRIDETRAKLEKLKAQKSKAARAKDTRRKIIAGAALFKAIEKDPDLWGVIATALQAESSLDDFKLIHNAITRSGAHHG